MLKLLWERSGQFKGKMWLHSIGLYVFWATINYRITWIMSWWWWCPYHLKLTKNFRKVLGGIQYLFCQILAKCDGQFCCCAFAVWEDPTMPTSLKRCIDLIFGIRSPHFCTEVNISILKQNKSTLWVSGNRILTIQVGNWEFTILQNSMVSYTYKDGTPSPECLAYWSKWL